MRTFTALSTILISLAAAACSSSASPTKGPGAPHAPNPSELPVSSQLVVNFDALAGELPEGLAIAGDMAFVGFAPTSQVVRVDLATSQVSPWGTLPTPVSGQGFMTGFAHSPSGELYVGLASFVPEVQAGIYRIPKSGGAASLFATDPALPFPNALAFDKDGALFVTDSGTGSIVRVDAQGHAAVWATGDALLGDKDACDGAGPGFAIGANGLVVEDDAIYVVNLDQATLLEIPRDDAGKAGAPVILAGPDCETLGGADGLAVSPDGSFVVAVNRQNKIVRVARDGRIETLTSGEPLDFPATLAYSDDTLFATNFALKNANANKRAAPGLVKIGD